MLRTNKTTGTSWFVGEKHHGGHHQGWPQYIPNAMAVSIPRNGGRRDDANIVLKEKTSHVIAAQRNYKVGDKKIPCALPPP